MNYEETYNKWINNPKISKEIKNELIKMSNEDKIISFSSNLEFSTAGARAIMGLGSALLNKYTIRKINLGLYLYLLEQDPLFYEKGIVIGYDNRKNSLEFAKDCSAFFTSRKVKVYTFNELRPTPEISYAVSKLGLSGGIMITASHNPKEYNGYKVYNKDGYQFSPSQALLLKDKIELINDDEIFDEDEIDSSYLFFLGENFDNEYYKQIEKISLNTDLDKKDFKIVYTPMHGAGFKGVTTILKRFNYQVEIVKKQALFDPLFANTTSLNPEEEIAYKEAILVGEKKKADLILCSDPDGDRIGACIFYNNSYKLLNGNQIGALLINYLLTNKKDLKNGKIITTIVSSTLGEKIALSYGVETIYTLTGFKFIGELLAINQYENFIIGYEESAGYLFSNICKDKDAIQASLLIAEMTLYYKKQGLNLFDVLNSLYKKHGYHLNKTISYAFKGIDGKDKIDKLVETFRTNKFKKISSYKVKYIEDYLTSSKTKGRKKEEITLPKSNVIKLVLKDGSYIAIRPSGTEPKCKIYYNIIAKNENEALKKLDKIINYLNPFINQ